MGQTVGKTYQLTFLLSFWFVLSITIASSLCTITLFMWSRIAYHHLINDTKQKVAQVANTTAQKIIQLIIEQHDAIEQLASQQLIINAFSNTHDTEQLLQLIKAHGHTIIFSRVLLLTTNGTVIFSTKANGLVGKKILSQEYEKSFFAKSIIRTIITETFDISVFGIDSLFHEPVLFICQPIIQNKKVIGILAVQLNNTKIYRLLSYKDLGTSGEIILGKQIPDGTIIVAPTRQASNIAFTPEGTFTKKKFGFLQKAVIGKWGTGIGRDYRDKKVIAAWRFIPMVNWGIVTTQEVAEIDKKLLASHIFFYISLIINLILLAWLAIHWYYHRRNQNNVLPPS